MINCHFVYLINLKNFNLLKYKKNTKKIQKNTFCKKIQKKKPIMRLSDNEIDCLLISNAGYLAQKRLARGILLNYPESVAIISSQVNFNTKFITKLNENIIQKYILI